MTDRPTPSARELVERLWSESDVPPPLANAVNAPSLAPSDHVVHRRELAFLNEHWIWDPAAATVGTARRGRVRTMLARVLARVLDGYLLEERAFVEALVRFQNELARKTDQLSEEVRALAVAQRRLAEAVDERLERLEQRADALHGALEARIERLENT